MVAYICDQMENVLLLPQYFHSFYTLAQHYQRYTVWIRFVKFCHRGNKREYIARAWRETVVTFASCTSTTPD